MTCPQCGAPANLLRGNDGWRVLTVAPTTAETRHYAIRGTRPREARSTETVAACTGCEWTGQKAEARP